MSYPIDNVEVWQATICAMHRFRLCLSLKVLSIWKRKPAERRLVMS